MDKRKLALTAIWCIVLLLLFAAMVVFAFDNRFLRAVLLSLFALCAYCVPLNIRGKNRTKGEQIIAQAIVDGTYVQGKRVGKVRSYRHYKSKVYSNGKSGPLPIHYSNLYQTRYEAKYEYIVNGKSYRKTLRFGAYPTHDITFYYPAGKPRKATTNELYPIGAKSFFLNVIVPLLIVCAIFTLTGVIDWSNLINICS